jgi:hypothetical protein
MHRVMQSSQNPNRPQRFAQAVESSPNEIRADAYFAIVPEWVLDATKTGNAVKLYAILARYADKGTGEAHPSRRTLAKRMKFARAQTVDPIVAELESIGAVEVFERYTASGDRDSNGYVVRTIAPAHRVVRPEGPQVDAPAAQRVDPPTAHKPESLEPESGEPEKYMPDTSGGPLLQVFDEGSEADRQFSILWEAWPRTESKQAAKKALTKAASKVYPHQRSARIEQIVGAGCAWAQGAARRVEAGQFQPIPYLASWLNQERWEEPAPVLDPVAPAGYDRDSSAQVQQALTLGARMDAERAAAEQGAISR